MFRRKPVAPDTRIFCGADGCGNESILANLVITGKPGVGRVRFYLCNEHWKALVSYYKPKVQAKP